MTKLRAQPVAVTTNRACTPVAHRHCSRLRSEPDGDDRYVELVDLVSVRPRMVGW